jgi:hypothetical protein
MIIETKFASIGECIKYLYPAITEDQFNVTDFGSGPVITKWNYKSSPQPTDAIINEAMIEVVRLNKVADIRRIGAEKLESLASPYTPQERTTWITQEEEAYRWLNDNSAQTPMISRMATVRGITIQSMIDKILENAVLFKEVSGLILGTQQKLIVDIYSVSITNPLNTIQQLESIVWN